MTTAKIFLSLNDSSGIATVAERDGEKFGIQFRTLFIQSFDDVGHEDTQDFRDSRVDRKDRKMDFVSFYESATRSLIVLHYTS
jgi:hypothetical protein